MLMKHKVNWILKKEFSSRIIYFMYLVSPLSVLKNKTTFYFAGGIRAHCEAKNMVTDYSAEPDW